MKQLKKLNINMDMLIQSASDQDVFSVDQVDSDELVEYTQKI